MSIMIFGTLLPRGVFSLIQDFGDFLWARDEDPDAAENEDGSEKMFS